MPNKIIPTQQHEQAEKSKLQAAIFYRVYDVILSWPEPKTADSESSPVKNEPQLSVEDKGQ